MQTQLIRIRRYTQFLVLTWTLSLAGSYSWLHYQESRYILEIARAEARVAFEKDTLYRKWSASHGGFYVLVDPSTPPNPNLSHVPERDVVTPSGKLLTLVNPAYMTRQVFEFGDRQKALVRGHITSLRPIRPENAPDPWERRALLAFERGAKEYSEVVTNQGQGSMRLMRPFVTEKGCLKCHARQGYRVGDIRGGVSVAIPLSTFAGYAGKLAAGTAVAHGILWFLGILLLWAGHRALASDTGIRLETELMLHEQALLLEQEIAERQVAQESLQEQAVVLEEEIDVRRHAEEKARLSEEKFSKAFQLAPVIMTISRLSDGTFLDVNDRFCELTGYHREETLGRTVRQLGLLPEGELNAVRDIFVGNGRVANLSRLLIAKDKRERLCQYWGETISVAGERCILSIALDVSEQRQLEEQLRHAQKLEAVGQLAGGVAHDFNNILTVILGYGNLMEMAMPGNDPLREKLGQMMAAAEKAGQLTRSLLAFSRKQVMLPQVTDLNDIVRGVQKLLTRVIGEDIELSAVCPDPELVVNVDRGQIEQVLMNLITNGRDAMPEGGSIRVETGVVEIGPSQFAGARTPGRYAVVAVTDTGIGMDEPTRKRVFEPFFTTKETGKGTGLGMAIVHGIVSQHSGFVEVESEPGRGSSFRVYLPLAEKEPQLAAGVLAEQPLLRGTETVLLAEDEESVRLLLQSVLTQYGYRVVAARDGQEAVELFAEHRSGLSLAVLDLVMPRKSGREAFSEIRRLEPGTRVLFCSGYSPEVALQPGEMGAGVDFILKPVQPLALLRSIRHLLDG